MIRMKNKKTSNFNMKTGQTEWMYWHAFHWVLVTTQFKFEPYKIVQDLKKTIVNASKDQFTDAKHNGCKFDSKQA